MATRLSGFVKGQKRFLGDIAHELSPPSPASSSRWAFSKTKPNPARSTTCRRKCARCPPWSANSCRFRKAAWMPRKTLCPAQCGGDRHPGGRLGSGCRRRLRRLRSSRHGRSRFFVRALANLVRNAVRYAGQAGPISITAREDRGEISILVSDCGPGLPAAEVERVLHAVLSRRNLAQPRPRRRGIRPRHRSRLRAGLQRNGALPQQDSVRVGSRDPLEGGVCCAAVGVNGLNRAEYPTSRAIAGIHHCGGSLFELPGRPPAPAAIETRNDFEAKRWCANRKLTHKA